MLERRARRSRYAKPPNISGWVLIGGLTGFIALVYLFTRDGCDNEFAAILRLRMVRVDTWSEWRDHLAGIDLYAKYRAFNVAYEPDSIRSDFLRNVPIGLYAGFPSKSAQWWNEGTILHIDTLKSDLEYKEAIRLFENLIKREWADLPQEEYFIHATIASLFQEVTIHGPENQTSRIALPFLYDE